MNLRKSWDTWGWLVALALLSLVVTRIAWGRDPFCGPETEHCFREWVSATGAWIAIPVALASVRYLAEQIDIMNGQVANEAKNAATRRLGVARRAVGQANAALSALRDIEMAVSHDTYIMAATSASIAQKLYAITEMLAHDDLLEFEGIFEIPVSSREIGIEIRKLGTRFEERSFGIPTADRKISIRRLAKLLERYCLAVEDCAEGKKAPRSHP